MKKATLVLIVTATVFGQTLFAQDFASTKTANVPVLHAENTDAGTAAGATVIEKPNAKFVAALAALFPSATAQTWRLFNGCYHVSFQNNNQKARAVFSAKGKLNYALSDCGKAHLPASLKQAIEKDYAAYQVVNSVQINAYGTVAHQALLESGAEYVTLKATEDGVEVVDRVKK